MNPDRLEIVKWLTEEDPERLDELWASADESRRQYVGEEVHLRGLIELSNHCVRRCTYCGINGGNTAISRYRMSKKEVMESAGLALQFGYGTVVLQAGEDPLLDSDFIDDIIRSIKRETGLAITLSLGERPHEDMLRWRDSGADRYLLRFETSDRNLFEKIHPRKREESYNRIETLRYLQSIGFEAGSGIMIGLPGQSLESIADDLLLMHELNSDMIGIGPYIPHPETPLGQRVLNHPEDILIDDRELTTCKVLAIARLLRPDANLPSTTALNTIHLKGRVHGLTRGANVIMPNLTPPEYRCRYEIYPNKAGIAHDAAESDRTVKELLANLGRPVGRGAGSRKHSIHSDEWLSENLSSSVPTHG